MTAPRLTLPEMLPELHAMELRLHAVMALAGTEDNVPVKRAAAVAHDALDALIEQIEVGMGAIREVMPNPDVDTLEQLMIDALRTVMPTIAIDRGGIHIAARAAVRIVKGFKVRSDAAPWLPDVAVPEVGPDGSILTPPGGPLVPVRPDPGSTATSESRPARPYGHSR